MMTKYIFEETQIGSHITTNFICIDRTDSVKEAMNQLLVQARKHFILLNRTELITEYLNLKNFLQQKKKTVWKHLL